MIARRSAAVFRSWIDSSSAQPTDPPVALGELEELSCAADPCRRPASRLLTGGPGRQVGRSPLPWPVQGPASPAFDPVLADARRVRPVGQQAAGTRPGRTWLAAHPWPPVTERATCERSVEHAQATATASGLRGARGLIATPQEGRSRNGTSSHALASECPPAYLRRRSLRPERAGSELPRHGHVLLADPEPRNGIFDRCRPPRLPLRQSFQVHGTPLHQQHQHVSSLDGAPGLGDEKRPGAPGRYSPAPPLFAFVRLVCIEEERCDE